MKRVFLAAAVAALLPATVALATESDAKTVPNLSGNYVWTEVQICGASQQYNGAPYTEYLEDTGIANFNPTTKVGKFSGMEITGVPSALSPSSGSGSYSNTATQLTVGGSTYNVFYGKVSDGVATSFSAITLSSGCGRMIRATR